MFAYELSGCGFESSCSQLYISWNLWVGGKFEYYKSMEEPQKEEGGGGGQIFKIQWGEAKDGGGRAGGVDDDFWT